LRALGVGIVMASHLPPRVIPDGGPGVVLFFVLSGYLITSLLLRERAARGRVALGSFWARRGLRLAPALWSVVAACALMLFLFRREYEPWASVGGVGFEPVLWCVTALTWTTSLVQRAITPANPLAPTWSLSIEEQFYLLWPPVVIAGASLTRKRFSDPRQTRIFAATLLTIAAAIMAARLTGPLPKGALFAWGRFDGIMIGCAIALVRRAGTARRTPPIAAAVAGSGFLAASIGVQFVSDDLAARTSDSLAVGGAVGLLLAALAARPDWPARCRGLNDAATWLGKRSYGVYLWHTPWVHLVTLGTGWSRWFLVTPVAASGALATAAVSYRWLEQPFRDLQARFRPY
jgi:peptidoglycan/LPS O-acetylase OafA/YrhL